ncbi:hypothetical protein BDU57DRAFT_589639 [Ampelomyces quisqualis]|uniref:DUF7580 domain-containing protein n=1 Tax=Ampelomyces quisqualis TaxID=50730 RepID=A0A6A5QBM9_AMPQU|nr:hypothetical protein BDU57DRAFT_589639 [Ampelomyces quisqualis]
MSGIEIAGLVFGVIPLVVEILKHYSTTKSRLTTFARHAEVENEIQLGFHVAAANFNNSCRLLLQAVVTYPAEVSDMMEHPTDKRWQEQGNDIEKRLRSLMEGDYDLCQNIITRIRDILRETHENLAKLEGGLKNTKHLDHDLTRKIWHAFNTSRKENEYVRQLDLLNKWNKALGRLRKQRCKIQKRRSVSSACIIRKAAPRSYQQIRIASQHLGDSLHDSWSCTNTSHSGHQAKLSLDAHSGLNDVQLDIVVACRPKMNDTIARLTESWSRLPTVPIWLQIRSITSVPITTAPTATLPTLVDSLQSGYRGIIESSPKNEKSKKRVRFNNPEGDGKQPRRFEANNAATNQAQSFVMLNLKTTTSFCCHLSQVRSSTLACQDGCVGYLEVKAIPTTRLIFYDASKLAAKERHPSSPAQESTPIHSLIDRLQILQQITLAQKLAEAVLQYHSTPWLPQTWTLQDIAYFKDTTQPKNKGILDALQSLHLSNQFLDHGSLDTKASEKKSLDLKHTYGVRNLTLAKLGVALLEICTQKDMTVPSLGHTPYEIIEARKLIDEEDSSIMTLGNRYLEIVRKCIYCDFSCDDDLGGDALQSAVYTEVVCALQEMRRRWEKFFGI